MKCLAALFLLPAVTSAATVFDGYEAYYASLPNRMFQSQGIALQPYSLEGDDVVRYAWQGKAAGRHQRIELRDGRLQINGRFLLPKQVKAFPDETVSETDLGAGTAAHFAAGWLCVENTPPSASGTAVRHKSVYLIKQEGKQHRGWKLPGLFASCSGIRQQGRLILVDQARYRYLEGQDQPAGVVFDEYRIRGDRFVATGHTRTSTFVEAGNVYKFSVAPD